MLTASIVQYNSYYGYVTATVVTCYATAMKSDLQGHRSSDLWRYIVRFRSASSPAAARVKPDRCPRELNDVLRTVHRYYRHYHTALGDLIR